MTTNPSNDKSDELRKRRERLDALKSKRETPAPPAAEPAPATGSGPTGGGGLGGGALGSGRMPGLGGGDDPKRQRQRKMLMKVYNVLTQTPEDEHGRVPDTPFTQSGVARLMEVLRTRSADPSQPGAKVAEGLLNFIQPSEGEETTSSGASVVKLQAIARRIESFRGKGRGDGRKAAW